MKNEVLLNDAARQQLKKGIDTVCNAVKATLGPQGRNVIINRDNNPPHITKDGVTVAKEIYLNDPYEMMGANLIKNIASKTCDDSGDGTTSSCVLAQAIIENGYNAIKTKKVNPIALKRGIEKASKMVVDFIQKSSINVNENPEITKNVAIISANNDEFIGGLISEAINNVGVYGAVTVEKSSNIDTTLSSTTGFRISQRGYLSPYFITNESKSECILEDVWIYITDKKLTKTSDVLSLLNMAAEESKSLLIIAEDVTEDALSTLVLNKLQAGIRVCAIKGPEFGDNRKNNLADIAILTGGEVDTIM